MHSFGGNPTLSQGEHANCRFKPRTFLLSSSSSSRCTTIPPLWVAYRYQVSIIRTIIKTDEKYKFNSSYFLHRSKLSSITYLWKGNYTKLAPFLKFFLCNLKFETLFHQWWFRLSKITPNPDNKNIFQRWDKVLMELRIFLLPTESLSFKPKSYILILSTNKIFFHSLLDDLCTTEDWGIDANQIFVNIPLAQYSLTRITWINHHMLRSCINVKKTTKKTTN